MKTNGLELLKINSKTKPVNINSIKDALDHFNSTGYIVAYLDYKVLIGKVNIDSFEFYNNETIEEKYIQRLRLFNNEKELLVWRDNNYLKGRLRIDNEGHETFVVDACQVLWGTDKKELGNGWIKLFEQRGTELILPYRDLKIDNKKHRLFLKTRNYISFHSKTHQATYTDCRFIGFTEKPL
ncbi:MAG: CRISPR-associated protein Csx19 [Thermodesulfovibrio sp.]|jgi:CRISPR-associated protein (TIGR03984 family)|uniref:type III-D CRISPR-associated protein Csx19 n=1 Tax=Thermodesulfovibrio sp. N1 TaxID=1871110 RepID=UPI00083A0360|nr:CRISPR-associated protein Csx19 [Thermodesulfovibrio sp. N1]MDI6714682.1 CRISPR-associated protein Csx19 [Thermodesulfovibrio sp.]ODA44131.1 hypothetical protein THER_1157 [Thermodesulfovibrio sp. N1]